MNYKLKTLKNNSICHREELSWTLATKQSRLLILIKTILICCVFQSFCLAAPIKTACVNSVCVNVDAADTQEKRAMGLMFKEGMGENEGMLFIFDSEGNQGFWMKNMRFPLDIIWIDADRRITNITENVKPCTDQACESYNSGGKIKYVLEVNAGFVKKNNIRKGQEVSFW